MILKVLSFCGRVTEAVRNQAKSGMYAFRKIEALTEMWVFCNGFTRGALTHSRVAAFLIILTSLSSTDSLAFGSLYPLTVRIVSPMRVTVTQFGGRFLRVMLIWSGFCFMVVPFCESVPLCPCRGSHDATHGKSGQMANLAI